MLWLWKGPLPFVPPEGKRTVIGQGVLVRQYWVPALLSGFAWQSLFDTLLEGESHSSAAT